MKPALIKRLLTASVGGDARAAVGDGGAKPASTARGAPKKGHGIVERVLGRRVHLQKVQYQVLWGEPFWGQVQWVGAKELSVELRRQYDSAHPAQTQAGSPVGRPPTPQELSNSLLGAYVRQEVSKEVVSSHTYTQTRTHSRVPFVPLPCCLVLCPAQRGTSDEGETEDCGEGDV